MARILANSVIVQPTGMTNSLGGGLQRVLQDLDTAINNKMQANGVSRITVGAAAPRNPQYGDIWIDTN